MDKIKLYFCAIVIGFVSFFSFQYNAFALTNIAIDETPFTYISQADIDSMNTWYNNQTTTWKSINYGYLIVAYPQTWTNGTLPTLTYKARFVFANNCGSTYNLMYGSSSYFGLSGGYANPSTSSSTCTPTTSAYGLNNNGVVGSLSSGGSSYAYRLSFPITSTTIIPKIVYARNLPAITFNNLSPSSYAYTYHKIGSSSHTLNTNNVFYTTQTDFDGPVIYTPDQKYIPYNVWKGDTLVIPTMLSLDSVEGNLSSSITQTNNVNMDVVGSYIIHYTSCDSWNNCGYYDMDVNVKEPMKTIDMTGLSAILFTYKDYSIVHTPNNICSSIDLDGSCFVQEFGYTGSWKYSKALLSDLNVLTYEDGGIFTPIDNDHVNIGHLTDTFTNGMEYGVFFYNNNADKTTLIAYNQKYFNYKIYKTLVDDTEKDISYIDINGTPVNITDTTPPTTILDNSAHTSATTGFFSGFSTNTFGLTAIVAVPLDFIHSLSTATCSPLVLPLGFVDSNITLPCMTSIYEDNFGTIFTLYQMITLGIISYYIMVHLLAMVKGFKNPDDDRIEVLDL